MNNFFYRDLDYDLFKKALRSTKNEPVVINILSNDSSLNTDGSGDNVVSAQRKQMSSKFQASPFDKFFGPRKKRTDPVDMKDFSSWRNKNFRENEKKINEATEETTTKFSFSDYLNSKTKSEKFNDEDKLKSEMQKPIDQISIHDEDYKKFSLDSYLNKLERESKVKKDFEQTEDLMDPFMEDNEVTSNAEQDENFMSDGNVGVEDVAFNGDVGGDKFAFDREELDTFKARLDKMEREANNIKDKPTTKVISTEEINEMKGKTDDDDDEFDLDKLGIEDDIERVNKKIDTLNKALQITGDEETETPVVQHKRFFEINKNFDDTKVAEKTAEETGNSETNTETASESNKAAGSSVNIVVGETDGVNKISENGVVKPSENVNIDVNTDNLDEETENEETIVDAVEMPEGEINVNVNGDLNKSELAEGHDYLTRADFKNFTEEIVNKFSEMYRETNKINNPADVDGFAEGYDENGVSAAVDGGLNAGSGVNTTIGGVPGQTYGQPYDQGNADMAAFGQTYQGSPVPNNPVDPNIYQQQTDLQTKIVELIEQNKKSDLDVAEKLQQAELEKQRVTQQYEARLRELEESMKKREEEVKQQAYIEKLRNDIKFKSSENKFKLREEKIRESEKLSSEIQLASEKLRSELKNCLNVSNLEMDKKLLECVNKNHKVTAPVEAYVEAPEEIEEATEETTKPERPRRATSRRTSTRRKTSSVKTRMRTRTPRRKIDSDIIGGIDFD